MSEGGSAQETLESSCNKFIALLKAPGDPRELWHKRQENSKSSLTELLKSSVAWQFFLVCIISITTVILSIMWKFSFGAGSACLSILFAFLWTFLIFYVIEKEVRLFVLIYTLLEALNCLWYFLTIFHFFGVLKVHIGFLLLIVLYFINFAIGAAVTFYGYKFWESLGAGAESQSFTADSGAPAGSA